MDDACTSQSRQRVRTAIRSEIGRKPPLLSLGRVIVVVYILGLIAAIMATVLSDLRETPSPHPEVSHANDAAQLSR